MSICSGPPVSLYKLLQAQNPDIVQEYMLAVESRNCTDILQAADAVSTSFIGYYCVADLAVLATFTVVLVCVLIQTTVTLLIVSVSASDIYTI